MSRAGAVLAALVDHGWSVATAESLTGGLAASAIIDVPGASASMRGGVIAYATDAKASVLGVDPALLRTHGPVHPDVAVAMAEGVRRVLDADVGLATTGVAGPEPQGGAPVGTVYIAVVTPTESVVQALALDGTREQIRAASVDRLLSLCLDSL